MPREFEDGPAWTGPAKEPDQRAAFDERRTTYEPADARGADIWPPLETEDDALTAPIPETAATGARFEGPDITVPAAGEHADPEGLSIGELVAEVTRDLSTLLRQEVELAKAEAVTSAKRAGKGAGLLGGAGYAGSMAVVFVSVAVWWALGSLVGLGWSALIVAALWAIAGAVLAVRGRREIRSAPGLTSTADSLTKIPHALQRHEEMNR